jgi:competence protein ComEA
MSTHRNVLVVLVTAVLLAVAPAAFAKPKRLEGVVNLNTASAAELQLLPGVGPAKAEAILAYRRLRPFRTVDELARIKGIGRKMVKKLRPHLSVDGATTARAAAEAAPPAASAADIKLAR